MAAKEYLVHELAEKSNVSVRNIRYYTDQGLIPPPDYRGKYAYYSDNHLKRLALIKNLSERRFPLSEIKAILNQLDEAGLDGLLNAQDQYIQKAQSPRTIRESNEAKQESTEDTVAFIDYLLGKKTAPIPSAPISMNQDISVPLLKTPFSGKNETIPGGESWERVSLAPGIELHIRQPLNPTDEENIKTLVETAKQLFKKRRKGG
jgi:DNA-binding transcriptional MerR regulator